MKLIALMTLAACLALIGCKKEETPADGAAKAATNAVPAAPK